MKVIDHFRQDRFTKINRFKFSKFNTVAVVILLSSQEINNLPEACFGLYQVSMMERFLRK